MVQLEVQEQTTVATSCGCFELELSLADVDRTYIGDDPANGRYAEVFLDRCHYCGQIWLHYTFVFESETASARWYRAPIGPELASQVTALNAARVLENIAWYIAGGSFFDGRNHKRSGRLL